MASLFKKTINTTKNGKPIKKESDYWHIRYKDVDDRWKEKKAFKDKIASDQLKAQIEKKIEFQKAGIIDKYEDDRKKPLKKRVGRLLRGRVPMIFQLQRLEKPLQKLSQKLYKNCHKQLT